MPPAAERVATYIPSGMVDSKDGNTSRPGAMASLQNLIPSPSTPNLYVCRPAGLPMTLFPGFTTPGYVSAAVGVGTRIYGMISTGRNAGHDEPFCYDTATGAFVAIAGVTAANTPTSPATTGAWTPPTMAPLGPYVVVTHPGFTLASGNLFGWFDMTGFTLNTLTGTTVNGSKTITTISANPLIDGLTPGMTISDASGDIPAGSVITSIFVNGATYTITLNNTMTNGHAGNALTIAGGTQAAPLWAAGNTNQNNLPSVPLAVANFNGRAYFACSNTTPYSDSLNPLNITNATQSLTIGGSDAITGFAPQPFYSTTQGGIVAALLVFKAAQIHQITGDVALSNLTLNKVIDGVGTTAPRTITNTPEGVKFEAVDGIRTVNLSGQVDPPNIDLTTPFLAVTTPSRSAAAYNEGVYRICSGAVVGGVLQTFDRWFDVNRQLWTGPHSITYDNIIPINATFVCTSPNYPGQLLTSNPLPGALDTYTENGVELSFNYQTALLPEGPAMSTQSILESSVFAAFTTQITLTANILDQSQVVLLTYSFVTPFMPPANPTNWGLLWSQPVTIPTRCAIQITGSCSQGVGLGTVFVRFQVGAPTNALNAATFIIPSDIDFGSVADPILTGLMDWGAVVDPALASFDFETLGTHPGGP